MEGDFCGYIADVKVQKIKFKHLYTFYYYGKNIHKKVISNYLQLCNYTIYNYNCFQHAN